MIVAYKHITKYLYDAYYMNHDNYSDVTSSHWREIGGHKVQWNGHSLDLKGNGFGNRIGNDWLRSCYSFPERMMLRKVLSNYPELRWISKVAKGVAKKQGTIFSYDCLRQALSLAFIERSLGDKKHILKSKGARVCIIGDGYGYLACLFKIVFPNIQVVEVNLGRTLLFDATYIQKVFPDESVALLNERSDCKSIDDIEASFVLLEAENYNLIEHLPVDLFVNIASMQEMDLSVVQNYFQYMRKSKRDNKYFYCCNRLEKNLPDGEIIQFSKYGWRLQDEIIIDELCPWYQKFPVPYPPFWKSFDGPIQHRFVLMQ